MRFFQRKWISSRRYDYQWQEALRKYDGYFAQIRAMLPPTARLFRERARMHDEVIQQFTQPLASELLVESYHYRLIFTGVKRLRATGAITGDVWLYEEIGLADRPPGFGLSVLLEQDDFEVVAQSVELFDKGNQRWLIREEPHDQCGRGEGGRKRRR